MRFLELRRQPATIQSQSSSLSESIVRKIIHIDMDAFYASVEQRDNPDLRGQAVAVGSAAKRGVVAAASYEARTFGVRSAMSSAMARRICPELVFVPPRFEVYRSISNEIKKIFYEYTPMVEPVAFDEAYLDVTERLPAETTAWITAREIRSRILQQTGLTASAGVSFNKFLAKLASGHKKPNGQFAILPDEAENFLAGLSVAKFHGIGPVTARKLADLGIRTGADLKQQSVDFLQSQFGKIGEWYHGISRGEDDRPVEHLRVRKSYSSETTFSNDLDQFSELEPQILALADEVWNWCEAAQKFGRTITVKFRFTDFKRITRSHSERDAINQAEVFREITVNLLRALFPLQLPIRLVGVGVSNFATKVAGKTHQLEINFE